MYNMDDYSLYVQPIKLAFVHKENSSNVQVSNDHSKILQWTAKGIGVLRYSKVYLNFKSVLVSN